MSALTELQSSVLSCLPPEPHTARVSDVAKDVCGSDTATTRHRVKAVIRNLEKYRKLRFVRKGEQSGGRPRIRYGVSCASWPQVEALLSGWGRE
jgi:hypothetical protein